MNSHHFDFQGKFSPRGNLLTFDSLFKVNNRNKLKRVNSKSTRRMTTFPLSIFHAVSNRYFSTFVEGPQYKYKQFDACIVLSCHQQKCYIFVNIDEYNLFDILLLLFTFLVFNLVF